MNPMQLMLNKMINSPQVQQNPMAKNAVNMLQNGDSDGLRKMAENLCHEKGIDFDKEFSKFKNQFPFR